MRSLLVPVGLVAFGLLAALPFRRSATVPVEPPAEVAGLPDTVTPLREAPLAVDWSSDVVAGRPAPTRFASVTRPAVNPYRPPVENLASSYQEVAVPLALPEDPGNLLERTGRQQQSLGRFGVPTVARPQQPEPASADARQSSSAALAQNDWQPERAIPGLEAASTLTSVLERPDEAAPKGVFHTVSESKSQPAEPADPAPRQRQFIREPR